ncbi:MAG: hypothetical protein AAFO74_15435 [Pseudomonadota bacterium]
MNTIHIDFKPDPQHPDPIAGCGQVEAARVATRLVRHAQGAIAKGDWSFAQDRLALAVAFVRQAGGEDLRVTCNGRR